MKLGTIIKSVLILLIVLTSFMAIISFNNAKSIEAGEAVGMESPFVFALPERNSPADRIKEEQIHVYSNRVIIDLKNAEWASFTDTNSMDPVIDEGANAIEIVPKDPAEITVGDIVSYYSERAQGTVIHRVIKIGFDDNGWYAIMKGDNNPSADPDKVRFEQVRRIVVAIIY